VGWTQWVTTLVELLVSKDAVHALDYILLSVLQYVTDLYFIPKVLKWWVATLKWVAGPEFLTLDSIRAPRFRH